MNATLSANRPNGNTDVARGVRRRMAQVIVIVLLMGGLLFVSAGRLDWVWGWVYMGVYAAGIAVAALVLLPRNPEMIAERGRVKENTKTWDRVLSLLIAIPTLGTLVVAGLDVRFGWSSALPLGVHLTALAWAVLGYGLFFWSMLSNAFFSQLVRIQADRGHTVATGGPYQYVRHPGYAGMIVFQCATAPLLGSPWALMPGVLAAALFVVRTALEDRTLQEELPGYPEYARRVRQRLLPGVW